MKDVQGSLTQAISDTDRNLGIKLTVCLHFALAIKHIKRFFYPFLPHLNPNVESFNIGLLEQSKEGITKTNDYSPLFDRKEIEH